MDFHFQVSIVIFIFKTLEVLSSFSDNNNKKKKKKKKKIAKYHFGSEKTYIEYTFNVSFFFFFFVQFIIIIRHFRNLIYILATGEDTLYLPSKRTQPLKWIDSFLCFRKTTSCCKWSKI